MSLAKTHVIYRAYDDEGTLLYVGLTRNLGRRLGEHESAGNRDAGTWFRWMSRLEVDGPYIEAEAYALEGRLITRMSPVFNRQRAKGGESPEQYLARRAPDEAAARREAMRHAMTTISLPVIQRSA